MRKMKVLNKWLYATALVFGLVVPSQAALFETMCMHAAYNTYGKGGGLNCTSNDGSVSDFRITWVGDGCISNDGTDTALVKIGVTIKESTAKERYDFGLYINTGGGDDAMEDGLTTNNCLHEALVPISTDAVTEPLDQVGGLGWFEDLDQDGVNTCGDIHSTHGDWNRTIADGYTQTEAIFEIACVDRGGYDINGDWENIPNGYIDLPWAAGFKSSSGTCTIIEETVPGGPAKCITGINDTKDGGASGSTAIGVPNLDVTIDCVLKEGTADTLVCTVNYNNNLANGPGDYIDFHVDYNETYASVNTSTYTTVNNSNDNATADSVDDNSIDGIIDWSPDDGVAIEVDDNGTLTFELVVDPNQLGDEINVSVMGYFQTPDMVANNEPATAQPLLYAEWVVDTGGGTTLPVTIAYVYPQQSASSLDVAFSTATEVGNVGFNIYAIKGHKWIKLNTELIEGALDSFEPINYKVNLTIPEDLNFKKIGVAGVDVNGKEDRHGPFKIGHESGSKTKVVKVDWKKVNKQVKADKKARKAAKKAARKATKVALKDQVINLGVSEDAVYRVTHDDLVASDIDLSGEKSKNIAISFRGEGVSRYVYGLNKKGKWTKNSFIEFMGTAPEGSDALYLDANQYQLVLNKKLVVKSDGIEAITVKELVFEENIKYGNLIPSDDPFYDGFFYAKGDKQGVLTRSIDLPKLDEETLGMTVYVSTVSDTNHNLIVSLNGVEVASATSTGVKEWPIYIKLDKNMINEGSNELTLTAIGSSDAYDMYGYDKLVLSYDDGQASVSVSPTVSLTNKVESRSIKPKKGTDYLIISHPLFMSDVLDGYIKERKSEGWNIQLVNVEDIYAAYGYGMETPEAIKDYLNVAERKGITHVQLIGASSYDYHDYLKLGSVSFIPSIYVKTKTINYSPSDTIYVSGDTEMPKLAIGRWPVRTLEGLEAVINKSLSWKASGQSSSHSALFVADAEDGSTNFAKQMDIIANKFETGKQWSDITRVYLDDFINQNNGDMGAAVTATRDAVIEAFSKGPSIVSYSGHSGPSAWSYEGVLRESDITSIHNIEKPAMLLPLACFTTYADSPSVNTMAHQLLVADEYGAVAIYGSARFSTYAENGMLTDTVIDNLFVGKTLGEAVLNSKNALGIKYRDTILNGTLLGDVTLKLR